MGLSVVTHFSCRDGLSPYSSLALSFSLPGANEVLAKGTSKPCQAAHCTSRIGQKAEHVPYSLGHAVPPQVPRRLWRLSRSGTSGTPVVDLGWHPRQAHIQGLRKMLGLGHSTSLLLNTSAFPCVLDTSVLSPMNAECVYCGWTCTSTFQT